MSIRRRVLLLLGAAVGVALLIATGPLASVTAPAPTRAGDLWPEDFVLHPGDRAVGTGQLVARVGEPVRLCGGNQIIPLNRGGQYRCSADSVELVGVDVGSMSAARPLKDALVVDHAVVRGVWDGRVLKVDSVGGAPPALPLPSPLTCQYNVPGAVREGPQTLATEADYRRLQTEVETAPQVYGGMWVGQGASRIAVVATTGDLVTSGLHLRDIFPYPLCLVLVRHPTAELERIATALRRPEGLWQPEVWVEGNRVLVHIPVLDSDAMETLVEFSVAEPRPLLIWDRPE
jgi:hypothetical protein